MNNKLIILFLLIIILTSGCIKAVGKDIKEKDECLNDLKTNIDDCAVSRKSCIDDCKINSCSKTCDENYLKCRDNALNKNNLCLKF